MVSKKITFNNKSILLKIVNVILVSVILLGAPMLAKLITNMFDFSSIDPDGSFMWITTRHIVQALIVFAFVIVLSKIFPLNFNLGLGNRKVGLSYMSRFMFFFVIYTVIVFSISLISGTFQLFQFPLTSLNITGYLGFQLLLSGPSEEFIFRAFAITMFSYFVSDKRPAKFISYATIFAMVIFGLAHVGISFAPFSIYYSLPQIFLAMGLGYFYGECYQKSQSVVYPMIMHSFTNVVMVGLTIVITAIMN